MRKWQGLAVPVAVLAVMGWSPARASGDYGCTTSWTTVHRDFSGCENMAVLGPGNDTRVNLMLMLIDRHGPPAPNRGNPGAPPIDDYPGFYKALYAKPEGTAEETYADGEGSRCRSNGDGAAAFEAAIGAAKGVPADERASLVAARRGFKPTCEAGKLAASEGMAAVTEAASRARSRGGTAFARYLQGTVAFYGGGYDTATTAFAASAGQGQPWLDDTAAYMRARVEVNRMQTGAFDEYGSFGGKDRVDQAVGTAAEAALRGYLRDHPRGAYAGSARGLLRRVYWLAGRTDRLGAEYAALLAVPPARRGVDDTDLAQEIDNKLLPPLNPGVKPAAIADPALLAVSDLMNMRADSVEGGPAARITRATIEAQRGTFAAAPALFDYLLAAHAFYVERDPARVLRLIPDATATRPLGVVAFSRQFLRGVALDAARDRNAGGFWTALIAAAPLPTQRSAAELGLAMHHERSGALGRVFDPGSPVRLPAIREILLTNVAGPALLRRQAADASVPAHERQVALFTLLYKELTRGLYRDFLADVVAVPAGAPADNVTYELVGGERPALGFFTQAKAAGDYGCASLPATAARLAAQPGDAKARLCLGEFIRVNELDGYQLDRQPASNELGGGRSSFPGAPFSRGETYRAIIAEPAAPAADKAYALFRAVRCYAPGGSNQCGGTEVPPAQRKAWFTRLKKDYPQSRWAQNLAYWW